MDAEDGLDAVKAWLRDHWGPLVAILAVFVLYAPTLGRGLVNYDDPWLYADNHLLQHVSWSGIVTVFTDLDSPSRYALSPEYLPIRDLSVMADYAVWGHHYGGFHLTNLVIYSAAIALWYGALRGFGVPKTIAATAILIWAVHPSHAESVAWLAERKGLLGVAWSGACAFAYTKYRVGGRWWWLAFAMVAGVAAVWSKAIAAFAVGAIAGLELVTRDHARRRAVIGVGAIGLAAVLAYIPVVMLAVRWDIVGAAGNVLPASRAAAVFGVHGFYLELTAGVITNAVSYPIASTGPSIVNLVIGALGFAGVGAALWKGDRVIRIAAVIWLFGWLPVGHLLLPLQMVFVADRYLLVPSLGAAIAIAWLISKLRPRMRVMASVLVVIGFMLRAFVAQSGWADNEQLWDRAIASNPADGNAWAMYLEALDAEGRAADAQDIVTEALTHSRLPRLVMHAALTASALHHDDEALALMHEAAFHGEPRAMANYANMLAERGQLQEALRWARYATTAAPSYANGHRIRGKVARLIDQYSTESVHAFERAYTIDPGDAVNRYNLGIAYGDAKRTDDARKLLESCLDDPRLARPAQTALGHL
ncbi:MAG: tetratricopeptide repeat protein [Kofleriaceae bacterium]